MPTVAIVGSRTFDDDDLIRRVIAGLVAEFGPTVVIVSGGSPGADRRSVELAREAGLSTREFLPDEARDGAEAHWVRNGRIADAADLVVAFYARGPRSPGTTDTIARAHRRGVTSRVFHEGRWSNE